MSYPVDRKAQIHSELALLLPRLAAFAAALTGSEAGRKALVKATRDQALSRAARERGHTPLIVWSFAIMHGLWAARMKAQGEKSGRGGPAPVPAAQPRAELRRRRYRPDGHARRPARPPRRRQLHLVYGERLSYDEVAEIFDCRFPVAQVISGSPNAMPGSTHAKIRA